jgi:FkbM family methyltransferase
VRSNEPPRAYRDVTTEAVATNLRDFLGVLTADDPQSVLVKVGSMEVEIPAWDTVILPWLREHTEWEPAVAEALSQNATAGGVVLDVGAHVGIFTLALSRLVGPEGRVVAVEADPVNARFLHRNVVRAHCDNVMVLDVAASDRTGVVKLSRSIEENTGDSRTYEVPTAGQVLEVPALALDDVFSGPVDLVKIDLQGTDHVAMRGMSRIIREHRPTIVTEYWPAAIRGYGDDPVPVLTWFRELGYSWSALEAPEVTDALSDQETCDAAEVVPTGYFNLVLRPTAL